MQFIGDSITAGACNEDGATDQWETFRTHNYALSWAVFCDTVIVAVDGRLETLFPELAGRVRTARLQMLATAPAPEVNFSRPVYWRQGYEYWQQLPDRSIALGGFRDHALEEEWTQDAGPTDTIQGRWKSFCAST